MPSIKDDPDVISLNRVFAAFMQTCERHAIGAIVMGFLGPDYCQARYRFPRGMVTEHPLGDGRASYRLVQPDFDSEVGEMRAKYTLGYLLQVRLALRKALEDHEKLLGALQEQFEKHGYIVEVEDPIYVDPTSN